MVKATGRNALSCSACSACSCNSWASLASMGLYVLRLQASSFCNSSQHFGANFFPIVEGPGEFIGVVWIFKLLMRTTLADAGFLASSNSLQGSQYFGCARGGPLTHGKALRYGKTYLIRNRLIGLNPVGNYAQRQRFSF